MLLKYEVTNEMFTKKDKVISSKLFSKTSDKDYTRHNFTTLSGRDVLIKIKKRFLRKLENL